MIVWGGVGDISNPTNPIVGGRYDPDSDIWQTTSTVNAPEGRVRHSAIWTGAEMIVWGGCPGLYCLNNPFYTGGHYDPATDSWTPTAIDAGIARARGEHSTVWTGQSMIVWGGFTDMGGYTNTGSEYFVEGAPPIPTPTATTPPHTPTATATLPPVTPTATATVPGTTPTATATTTPPSPTATGVPPTNTPTATGVPPTATATAEPPAPTATTTAVPAGDYHLYLPIVWD